jgi:hypothetical protein
MTKQERIKAALVAGAEAREMGKPEEPPKGLSTLEYASWRIGWSGTAPADLDFEMIDIGDTGQPVRVQKLTEEENHTVTSRINDGGVYKGLQKLRQQFQNEHKHQPGEEAWFVFTNPEPRHATILREFVEQHRATVEALATERGRSGKAYTFRAHYARAALGLMQKSQFTRPADRTHAVPTEWLVEAGWTPTKTEGKAGNAYRPYWGRDGRKGRINVTATADGWRIMFTNADNERFFPFQNFSNAAAAYAHVHMNVNLEEPRPPLLPAPEPEDWIAT